MPTYYSMSPGLKQMCFVIWVALLATHTLFSCKKEPKLQRHKDYMQAEFDGHKVDLEYPSCIMNDQGLLNISGGYKISQKNQGSIVVSICNLPKYPQNNWYPLFLDTSCNLLPSKKSRILINHIYNSTFSIVSHEDDGFSKIYLEVFNFESPQKFEAKGTYQFKGIQVNEFQPPPYPEKIVTGSFHFKYPPNEPFKP